MKMAVSGASGASPPSAATYILYTDIYRSSHLTETYPQEYILALKRHNALVEETVMGSAGRIYLNTGDGYIAFFADALNCLNCAVKLQQAFAELPILGGCDPFLVRVIVHAGLIRQLGENFFSPALNRANRICQACHPGQVLLSGLVKAAIGGRLEGTELIDLGEHHLRDLSEPERLFQVSHPAFARKKFPPLPTLASRPNNLQMRTDDFIGRKRELAELKALLAGGSRLVTITAPGGYGKSRIAEQLCAELLPEFERGVFFIELAPVHDSGGIAAALADALGFKFFGIREPQQQLIDYLREKEILLCFDNFEHLASGAALVAGILSAATRAKVIITSRESLHLAGETVFVLHPLGLAAQSGTELEEAEALQLFARRATLVNPDFRLSAENLEQIAVICRILEGIPLAIEHAAAWTDSFTPAELAGELDRQLDLASRSAAVPYRHSSLKASLDWGWNLLAAGQQQALMQLAPFQGGCFADAAAAALDSPGMETRRRLAGLIDKSWLVARDINERKRFFMRDAITHAYAQQAMLNAQARGSATVAPPVFAHARYFAEFLAHEGPKLAGHGQMEAMESFRLELPNVLAAMETLLGLLSADASAEEAARLLLPMVCWIGEYLTISGKYREARERYAALAVTVAERYPALDYWASLHLGRVLLILRETDRAELQLARAKALAEASGNRALASRPISELGTVELQKGNSAAARRLFEAALAIRREYHDAIGTARTLSKLGVLEQSQGNHGAARRLYAESLGLRQQIGDISGTANSLSNLGTLERAQRNYAEARRLYEESLELVRALGDRNGIARALNNLAILEHATANLEAAGGRYRESLAIYQEIGDRINSAVALGNLGILESAAGNAVAARDAYHSALAIARDIGDRGSSARLLHNLGALEQDQGDHSAALALFQEALLIFEELNDRANIATALGNLAILDITLGNPAAARGRCLEALRLWLKLADERGLCDCLAVAGSLLAGTARSAAALALFGAMHHAQRLDLAFEPLERQLLDQGLAALAVVPDGLAEDAWELKTRAEAMSLAQLGEATLAALAQAPPCGQPELM